MRKPVKYKIGILACLLLSCLLIMPLCTAGSNHPLANWSIITPTDKSDVKSGELLVTIQLGDNIDFIPGSVYFFVDDILITANIKIRPGKLSMLYMLPLRKGKHKLEIRAKEKTLGWMKALQSEFYVGKVASMEDQMAIDTSQNAPKKKFESTGIFTVEYSNTSINGSSEAKAMRQAQPYVAETNLDVVSKVQDFTVPVKMTLNSNEYNYQKTFMPRNYFQAGLIGRQFNVTVGDINPYFDRLVMTGIRVRGLMASYQRQRLKLTVVQGISQRAVEGIQVSFNGSSNILPDQWNGSNYIIPGFYQRNITAMRLSLGNAQEGSLLNFNVLRAKDDVNSIQLGQNPKENLVFGLDQQFLSSQSGFKMNAGFAFSLYTDDISSGIATKKEMDSAYGRNFSVNPADFKDLFTINSTTIRLTKTSTAGYVSTSINVGTHTISGEYRFIGSAFQSLGNPYLRNDILSITLQDQFRFWGRKMSLITKYMYSENNLIGQMLTTTTAHLLQSNLLYTPAKNLPSFGLNINSQFRETPMGDNMKLLSGNDLFVNVTATINYRRETKHLLSLFNFFYTNTFREDYIVNSNNTQNHIFSIGANESHLATGLSADVRYTFVMMGVGDRPVSPLSNTFDSRIRYIVKKSNLSLGSGFLVNTISGSAAYDQGAKYTYLIELKKSLKKDLQCEAELRYAPYHNVKNAELSYKEFFVRLKMVYFFNYR